MNFLVADRLFAINQLTLVAAAGIAGGLYLFIRGFRVLTRKRLLIDTPTSKIRSASVGLVEVSGVATGPYTIPAPITGNPCYLYRTIAWRQREESKSQEWKKIAEETLHVPFFLDDGTGKLLVSPGGAELDLHRDFCEKYDQTWISRVPERATTFLARHGITPEGDHFRIEEWTIRPQSPLYIVGTLAENPGVEVRPMAAAVDERPSSVRARNGAPSNISPPEVVRLSEPALPHSGDMSQQSKIAAALTKAGITSPAAWEAAGVPYRGAELGGGPQVREIFVNAEDRPAKLEGPIFDPHPAVVLMKGENNPAFLISWQSQHDVVRSLARKSAAMIWGGSALILLGIHVLIQQGIF